MYISEFYRKDFSSIDTEKFTASLPPRDSEAWEKEYDRRTSVERSNKREKEDYKLEDGRHRSTKMWYCRLYGIMMLQHLDAWEMPSAEAFQESFLGLAA